MGEYVETIIVGGGQAGLSTSYCLKQLGREHAILEQSSRPAHIWEDERWDSFTLVTPNWTIQIPGAEYSGDDPGGFLPRDEIVAYFRHYVAQFDPPLICNTRVSSVQREDDQNFVVQTDSGGWSARNVVIASGFFSKHRIPPLASQLPKDILQIHTGQYRNPAALPPGAVLVVGSAQSGCQVTEDLYLAGRKVYLCVGRAPRGVRRYRGKDVWEWFKLTGFYEQRPQQAPSPQSSAITAPAITGARGGHSLNLHQFARDGVTLLGRLTAVVDGTIHLGPDLMENLRRADQAEQEQTANIDKFIAQAGIDAPPEQLPALTDGFNRPVIESLDLRMAGITTVIWAAGYEFDYRWVGPARLTEFGFPAPGDGVANTPGIYFAGVPMLPKLKTGFLIGQAERAGEIATHIAARRG